MVVVSGEVMSWRPRWPVRRAKPAERMVCRLGLRLAGNGEMVLVLLVTSAPRWPADPLPQTTKCAPTRPVAAAVGHYGIPCACIVVVGKELARSMARLGSRTLTR